MIYLDTHVVVWLYAGLTNKFSGDTHSLLNNHDLYISPMVRLELQYLYEIQRVTATADMMLSDLSSRIGLRICDKPFNDIVSLASAYSWIWDPFDRLIVAHAALHDDILLSTDSHILANYPNARWG